MEKSQLFGRRLPLEQAPASGHGIPALRQVNGRWRCQRCQQWVATTDYLPQQIPYCRHCLNLGRLTAHTKLYTIPEPNQFATLTESPLNWPGQLSPIQLAAAQAVKRYTMAGRDQLLWAVTGAGKTEIGFPALAWALQQGWRVAWTSPRVDVCLELAPRLAQAFTVPQTVLYGGQALPYKYCPLTICTTHQLLRFEAAFDWLIVDEVDAFPLATSPLLQLAVKRAQKPTGSHLYLTATPGRDLQRQVQRRQLAVTYLPLRYHGYLLPPIQVRLVGNWRQRLSQPRLPGAILRRLRRYQQTQQRYLLFVPHVADLSPVQHALQHAHLDGGVTVHAADPDRQSKVQAIRDQQVTSLITTTILERGVTFPAVNVVILGGDDAVFSTAALVQMAGRVGRHPDHPGGEVICYCHSQTRAVQRAQRMIRTLNRKGRRLGGRRP
ncbi:helicase-related protein [Levilactobacillus zymae]|uniref:DEAD/DEAH box helicase n=1 Tax=Levilactobacillus zymae TaxID=267363 RepID=UPI0028B382DB|nr:helicase-related protein [Levilactobacillus zymae]MDT6980084.1 helicase-related protein [Levilactobacillus zymae]